MSEPRTRHGRRAWQLVAGVAAVACAALVVLLPAGALPAGTAKVGMVCKTGPTFDLVANSGYAQTPDGNSIFMWSYSLANAPAQGYPSFQTPGPVLCVNEGDTVTINLTNQLPEAASIVFPGQDSEVSASGGAQGLLTSEAAANGGTVSYTFVAGQPGTYLYESGTDVSKQIEMGLYGALVVRPSMGAEFAYDRTSTQFDASREYLILLAEIDPVLHHAVETGGTYDFSKVHNRYFTVNGRGFPDTIQDNATSLLPTQPYGALVRLQPTTGTSKPALIRMLNAGIDNHPFHPHGNHLRQIAQDGRLLLSPSGADASTERFGETIGSGETEDYLIRWDDQLTHDDWNPNTNPLPVAQPNYRDLTFKDGNTWYSGSPYLGYKGTLPTGVTSQNVCGEWYFPWHSHALNEFTNFDEGFGGMATLLRVDPPGGCLVYPAATAIAAGTLNGGTFADLAADDASYYKVNSTTTAPTTTDWYGQFSGVPAGAKNLRVTYKGNDVIAPTTGPTYTQNFTSPALASSGTSSTLPAGWSLSETGSGANSSYTANNGGSATGDTYSYGANGSTDRALGSLRDVSLASTFGAAFTNTTGGTITSLSIQYTGERWRRGQTGGGGNNDRLDFQYSLDATSLTTGTWTDVNTLDFPSPSGGGSGAVNGNAGNQSSSRTAIISGLSIPNGAAYRIRWVDSDVAGADDGLAVDSFSLTPTFTSGSVQTTVSVYNWSTSSWVQIAGPTAVGAADVVVANNQLVPAAPVAGSWAAYVGTGANNGRVRVRVLSTDGSATFVTGGNLMRLNYDVP